MQRLMGFMDQGILGSMMFRHVNRDMKLCVDVY